MSIVYDSLWKLAFSVGFVLLAASCVTMKIAAENLLPHQLESDKQIIIQEAELKIASKRNESDQVARIKALIDANKYQKEEVSAIMEQATTVSIYFMRAGVALVVSSIILLVFSAWNSKNNIRSKENRSAVDGAVPRSA